MSANSQLAAAPHIAQGLSSHNVGFHSTHDWWERERSWGGQNLVNNTHRHERFDPYWLSTSNQR
jgi:hypothetical protein